MAGRPRKDKVVAVKVDPKVQAEFKEIVEGEGLTVSSAIRNFMIMRIRDHRKQELMRVEHEKMVMG